MNDDVKDPIWAWALVFLIWLGLMILVIKSVLIPVMS